MTSLLSSLRDWARRMKREFLALSLALADPRTPWTARLLGALVLAYAASPIDLVPDFIPLLGYLDDLLLVPIGLWLVLRLVPPRVLEEARGRVDTTERPTSWVGALLVLAAWAAASALAAFLYQRLS